MKLLAASAVLLALTVGASAQDAQTQDAQTQAAPPTCATALPQITGLVDQAEAGGLEVAEARDHVGTAEAAQAAGDEGACIDALVLAQNTVLDQVNTPPS